MILVGHSSRHSSLHVLRQLGQEMNADELRKALGSSSEVSQHALIRQFSSSVCDDIGALGLSIGSGFFTSPTFLLCLALVVVVVAVRM